MKEKYYINGTRLSKWENPQIKCTCGHCGYRFIQNLENCNHEITYSSWDTDKKNSFDNFTFSDKCPNCEFNAVKDDKQIRAEKLKNSRDLTQKINDAAVTCLKRHFTNIHVGAKEIGTGIGMGERVDAILFDLNYSYLVETKISRADFLNDFKKDFRINASDGMGDYRYYACPTGLIKPEELPEKWGLIYVDDKFKATLMLGKGSGYACISKGVYEDVIQGRETFKYDDVKKIHESYKFDKNTWTENQLLISLCKRYKTRTGIDRLI
jgi:hypothetical protein